jgi:hypothetical protein
MIHHPHFESAGRGAVLRHFDLALFQAAHDGHFFCVAALAGRSMPRGKRSEATCRCCKAQTNGHELA